MDIFTDGGCDPNPGIGGWGVVAYKGGQEVMANCGGELESTNNRMELMAIIKALEFAAGNPCRIFSDSRLCINTLTLWAKGWKKNGWKRKDGEVKNLDLVQRAYSLFEAGNAKLLWVKGHSGIVGNERADRLAAEGRVRVINQLAGAA